MRELRLWTHNAMLQASSTVEHESGLTMLAHQRLSDLIYIP